MSDMSLEVLKESMPEGHIVDGWNGFWKEAMCRKNTAGELQQYHWCKYCGGWIKGVPEVSQVHDPFLAGQLVGRKGTAYRCARCGGEISFQGVMS